MTRSVLCIGLVAAAASQADGGALATALDRGGRDAASAAARACLGSSDCIRVGAGLLGTASVATTLARPKAASDDGEAKARHIRPTAAKVAHRPAAGAAAPHPTAPARG